MTRLWRMLAAGCASSVIGLAVDAAWPASGGLVRAADDVAEVVRTQVPLALVDLMGRSHELGQNEARVVRAFVFLSTDCPISNGYVPTLNALSNQLKKDSAKQVELFGVVADPTVSRAQAAKHFHEDFKLTLPVLFDASGLLAAELKPTHVPEAFVVDPRGRVVYRGAIDNAWEVLGRRRPKAESHFLADAIEAARRGVAPKVAQTKPIGCHIELPPPVKADSKVTFARDIAPLVQTRCMNCHRLGQVAPFSLTNYDEVAKHAAQIVEVTQQRIMPPWMPNSGIGFQPVSNESTTGSTTAVKSVSSKASTDCDSTTKTDRLEAYPTKFVGERWLTERELMLLKTWAETGRAKGDDADLPPVPTFAEGWQLGQPDLVVKMAEPFTVRADGPDLLQNFVIPIDIAEDKLVSAIEFHPGNKRVVHHAVLFLDDKGQARKLDAATPEPGYSNFGGPGFLPSGALGGWSVGNTARHLPNEMGRYLKKGSDLIVQVHYHPTGKVEVDQSEIGIYFVKKPVAESLHQPAKLVGSIWMANYEMEIPAGQKNYRRSTTYTLPRDVILVGVVPHMHLLGKSMKVTATLPRGIGFQPVEQSRGKGFEPVDPTSRRASRASNDNDIRRPELSTQEDDRQDAYPTVTLIDVPNWNYNWQDEYYYEQPFKLPAGTKLTVEAVYDNSADNPSNPSRPPRRVTWGDETTDEMLFCFFLLTADKTEDLIHTIFDNLGHDLKQPRKTVEK